MLEDRGEALRVVRRQAIKAAARVGLDDRARREDVAQEVMVRAWQSGALAMPPQVRGAWVRTTARRCAVDVMRQSRREGAARATVGALAREGEATMSEARLDARRGVRAVAERAREMPPSLRAVFDAVVCEGRAIDEVACALRVSRAVVDTRLRRMRLRLAA